MKWLVTLVLGIIIGYSGNLAAQPEEYQIPETIALERNVVEWPERLASCFGKLKALQAGERHRVRIVHLGDSHIQADWFTGRLREVLQARFGDGGRGMVFPYRTAGTHGPVEVWDKRYGSWQARRHTFRDVSIPLGICGMTVQTRTPSCHIAMALRNDVFDCVRVFSSGKLKVAFPDLAAESVPSLAVHTVQPGETLYSISRQHGASVAQLMTWNDMDDALIRAGQHLQIMRPAADGKSFAHGKTYLLPTVTDSLVLTSEGACTLFGVSLEKESNAGLIFDAIGVNGATYTHFNRANLFWDQVPGLEPDLIIVSLGTNEAIISGFQEEPVYREANKMLDRIRETMPGVPLLLTMPPDGLRRNEPNDQIPRVRELWYRLAEEHQAAVWDLYTIMGGMGSVRQWKDCELVHTDFIHFTKAGYQLQADLLLQALLQAYGSHD